MQDLEDLLSELRMWVAGLTNATEDSAENIRQIVSGSQRPASDFTVGQAAMLEIDAIEKKIENVNVAVDRLRQHLATM